MDARHLRPHLRKEITLFDAIVYGVGMIIGAGIYSLVGKGAGLAENGLWLSFAMGGAVALLTGLSYAELSSAFSKDAMEYLSVMNATKNHMLSFVIGWLTIFAGMAAGATVALGFGGYVKDLFGVPVITSAVILILVCAATDFFGLKLSSRLILFLAALQVMGLIAIIYLGAANLPLLRSVNYLDFSGGFDGIFSASVLVFFAYIGFEGIANMSEEVKNPRKTVPLAVIFSIVITTVIYVLIAIVSVGLVDPRLLSASDSPMSLVAASAAGNLGVDMHVSLFIAIIAIVSTASTVMINLVVISRIMYGLRKEHTFPASIGIIHPKTNVPYVSIFVVGASAMLFTALGNIVVLANLATFSILLAFFAVNSALISLRFDPSFRPKFRLPLSVRNVPVTAVAGAAWCAFMLSKFDASTATNGSILILAGVLLFMSANKP